MQHAIISRINKPAAVVRLYAAPTHSRKYIQFSLCYIIQALLGINALRSFFMPLAAPETLLRVTGPLSEASTAAAHNLALAHQLGAKLRAIERQVDIKVDTVKGSLWRVHALKVFFEVLA